MVKTGLAALGQGGIRYGGMGLGGWIWSWVFDRNTNAAAALVCAAQRVVATLMTHREISIQCLDGLYLSQAVARRAGAAYSRQSCDRGIL